MIAAKPISKGDILTCHHGGYRDWMRWFADPETFELSSEVDFASSWDRMMVAGVSPSNAAAWMLTSGGRGADLRAWVAGMGDESCSNAFAQLGL